MTCRRELRKHGDVKLATQRLIRDAEAKSTNTQLDMVPATSDNISVIVIGFAKKDKTIVPPVRDNDLIRPPGGSRFGRRRGFGRKLGGRVHVPEKQ